MSGEPGINLGKSRGRRILDRVEGFATSVGPEAHFRGAITGAGHCIVYGHVEGDCDIAGTLVVAEGGRWVGEIVADNVLIAGQVAGSLVAREKMEIVSTARIRGKLACRVIAIAEGAVHDGELQMGDVTRFADRRDAEPSA
ncbi:MAG TPA: polymer-forming cytoskeletal protein [Gammaproteobacteria bacterium]|nr:polymer-forming cytoskeletal protein [Gammaproteobacteria bacterium]